MKLTEKIGSRIRKFRQAKKISQEELAYRTGMHQSQIYMIENGKRRINTDQLEKISEALGVPVIKFFQADTKDKEEFDNQQLLEIISQMSQEKKKELTEILKNVKDFDFKILRKAVELVKLIKEG